jgi:dienelactone hydrolase
LESHLRIRIRHVARWLTLIAFASVYSYSWAAASKSEPLPFNDDTVGPSRFSFKSQVIYLPEGKGPSPAVLILTKCWIGGDGYEYDWGKRLASWGYVALVVNSLSPRGVDTICANHGNTTRGDFVPPTTRLLDLFAALAYLRSRPDVDPARVGAIGIDAGAGTALRAANEAASIQAGVQPLQAVVASSPGGRFCAAVEERKLASDLLMMAGEKDDFDPGAVECLKFRDTVDVNGHDLRFVVYPGAYHNFDTTIPIHFTNDGYTIGRDPAAAADSIKQVQVFFEQHLRGATH